MAFSIGLILLLAKFCPIKTHGESAPYKLIWRDITVIIEHIIQKSNIITYLGSCIELPMESVAYNDVRIGFNTQVLFI